MLCGGGGGTSRVAPLHLHYPWNTSPLMLWCVHTHSDRGLFWCGSYILRPGSHSSLPCCLFLPPCRLLCNIPFLLHPHPPLCNQIPHSPSLPLSLPLSISFRGVFFLQGTSTEFLSSASTAAAASPTELIACSELGIGRCTTTCSCAVTNQKDKHQAAAALFGTRQRRASSV